MKNIPKNKLTAVKSVLGVVELPVDITKFIEELLASAARGKARFPKEDSNNGENDEK